MSEKNKSAGKDLWRKLTPKVIAVIVVLGAAAAAVIGVRHCFFTDTETTRLGFEDIGELATQVAYCTEVNVSEESRTLFGVEIPFTQSKNIFSYDVEIRAGLDFREVEWSLDEEGKAITVLLPSTQVLSSQVIFDSFQLYHEDESIFRPITLEETNAATNSLVETAKTDAVANGLLDNARENAEALLTAFLQSELDLSDYEIEFSGGEPAESSTIPN